MNARDITLFISESALAYTSSLKTLPIELESKCKLWICEQPTHCLMLEKIFERISGGSSQRLSIKKKNKKNEECSLMDHTGALQTPACIA